MNKLFASALLTIVAVPFLSAAPKMGAGKGQNSTAPAATATTKPVTKTKKHVVKTKKTAAVKTNAAATPSK